MGGPDVWVVARVFRDKHGAFEDIVSETAELTELPKPRIRVAMRYYAEYRDEIDEWMRELDEYAEKAEAAWLREQALTR
jgi:hypothetical protein